MADLELQGFRCPFAAKRIPPGLMTCSSPVQDTLSKIVQEVTAQLYEYVMDRNASHVVRNLLCAIAGRNLLDVKGHGRRGGGDTGAASKVDIPFSSYFPKPEGQRLCSSAKSASHASFC